ncbi:MAG: hypothetical protein R2751_18660 [Bacteroidales bacterium]
MNHRLHITGLLSLFLSCHALAQITTERGIWQLNYLTGELELKGQYRSLQSQFGDLEEDQQSAWLLGGLKINSRSSLWDPDVLQIDLNAAYRPENRNEQYIHLPDRTEVRTLKKVETSVTILQDRPLSARFFLDYDHHYANREQLTNVRTELFQWGARFGIRNKVFPLALTYRNSSWKQKEIQSGRLFQMDQEQFVLRGDRSFGTRDRTEIHFSLNDYAYAYAGLHTTRHLNSRMALENQVYADQSRKFGLNSRISRYEQTGTHTFRRVEWNETMQLALAEKLQGMIRTGYYDLRDDRQTMGQTRLQGHIEHKLYSSLRSKAYAELASLKLETEQAHKELDVRGGVDLRYVKKIPTGTVHLETQYQRHRHESDGVSVFVDVIQESHVLLDGHLVMLDQPYVVLESVLVSDADGLVQYQEGFDYLLLQHGNFVEIQRVPGGQIGDGEGVLVNYRYRRPGAFRYGSNHGQFRAGIRLFDELLEFYYRYGYQNYPRLEEGDLLVLNAFTQHVAGIRVDLGFLRAGLESDRYNSSLVPYQMMRYYLNLNLNLRTNTSLSLNGSLRDYAFIGDNGAQMYGNVAARINQRLGRHMKVSVEPSYLRQRGEQIELDLLTGRAEFQANVRQLEVRSGLELYRRLYQNSSFAFHGAYLRLIRHF